MSSLGEKRLGHMTVIFKHTVCEVKNKKSSRLALESLGGNYREERLF